MNTDDESRKSFIAQTHFAGELDRRSRTQPGYLRRNLRLVLDEHDRETQRERGHAPDSISHKTGIAKWDFPREKALGRMMKNHKDTIRIPDLRVVPLHGRGNGGGDRRMVAGEHAADRPEWLSACDEWRVWCQVFVRILHQSDTPCLVHYELREAQISRHEIQGSPAEFEIQLEEPFEIGVKKLQVEAVYDDDGVTRWLRTADTEGYSMEFGIRCQSSEDAAEFWSQLEHRNVSTYRFTSGKDALLTCSWDALPDLPPPGHVMKLKRAQEERTTNMRYGVEASIFHGQSTPIVTYNRTLHLKREARQLPTPSVSDDLENSRTKMQVQYLTRTNFTVRAAFMNGLKCILCRRDMEHSSPERLLMHYLTIHDHMRWAIDYELSNDNLLVVKVEVDDTLAGQNDGEEPHADEMEWVAPKSAFNMKAHLQGDQRWMLPPPKGSRSVHNTPRHPKSTKLFGRKDKPLAQPQLQPLIIESRKRKVTAPEDVANLEPCQRKRHPVPEVEGISFYRTISKQRVAPGTEISDSEDEADTSWVLQSQRRDQTRLGVSQVAQNFNELLNRHLDEETPLSDFCTRDTIVRFSRKYRTRLGAEGWRDQFEMKLRQLESKKVVNADTVKYCLGLVTVPQTNGAPVEQGEIDADRQAINEKLGVTSPVQVSRKAKMTPLGHRDILCKRPGTAKTSGLIPIKDLLFDSDGRKARDKLAVDAVGPHDVNYEKLVQILDRDLGLRRDIDHIVCTGVDKEKFRPIVGQKDLVLALSEHVSLTTDPSGPIIFEVHDQMSFEKGLEQNRNPGSQSTRGATTDGRQRTSKDGQRAGAKKKECICGVAVEGVKGAFSCGNPLCWRNFHLACMSMDGRPEATWRCEDCSR